jgi:group I intron endonuclease
MIIYKITNKINGMVYIGMTKRPLKIRWKAHLNLANSNKNFKLHQAIKKFGKENFDIIEIAGSNSIEELDVLERHFISLYACKYPNGYNMTVGGKGSSGIVFTDKQRKQISERLKNRPPVSNETRLKLSKASKGRVMPKEIVELVRIKRLGQKRTNEQKSLISNNRKGKGLLNDSARKFEKEKVFLAMKLLQDNIKQAEIVKLTGLTQSYISNLKTGKRGKALLGDNRG